MGLVDPPPAMPPTPLADVDAAIDALYDKRRSWLAVSPSERAALLEECVASIRRVAPRWVEIGARIEGGAPTDDVAGREWTFGVMPTIRSARLLANALRQGGSPRPPAMRTRSDGHRVARIHPSSAMERLLLMGVVAEVWLEKGKPESQGAIYRSAAPSKGRVCLVLGGGNVASAVAIDALYKLFVENEVVLLKMSPVNEALGPVLAEALAPLVSKGWLEIVYGGPDVGARAAAHAKVGSLHVAGSDRIHDDIVWGGGSPAEREERKRGKRANDKPLTGEVGCVTPVIVVPGPWSHADVRWQARHVASMLAQNASFDCDAAQVVLVARQWLQKDAFLSALREELRKIPPRKAHHPGARERRAAFVERHPRAEVVGETPPGAEVAPWTVLPDVTTDECHALAGEACCGVVAEVQLDAPDFHGASVPRFLEAAVKLANESRGGARSCCLLVHPATEDAHAAALGKALEDLRYAVVGVNVWPGAIHGLVSPPWSAYPGRGGVPSGAGVVHDAWLFDHPEKCVVRARFRIRPKPPWFADNRNLVELGRRLVDFEAAPSWGGVARVALAAIRG